MEIRHIGILLVVLGTGLLAFSVRIISGPEDDKDSWPVFPPYWDKPDWMHRVVRRYQARTLRGGREIGFLLPT
jgi:hypothetical protein